MIAEIIIIEPPIRIFSTKSVNGGAPKIDKGYITKNIKIKEDENKSIILPKNKKYFLKELVPSTIKTTIRQLFHFCGIEKNELRKTRQTPNNPPINGNAMIAIPKPAISESPPKAFIKASIAPSIPGHALRSKMTGSTKIKVVTPAHSGANNRAQKRCAENRAQPIVRPIAILLIKIFIAI